LQAGDGGDDMSETGRDERVESYKRMILATHDHLEALLAELEKLSPAGEGFRWIVECGSAGKVVRVVTRFHERFHEREDDES